MVNFWIALLIATLLIEVATFELVSIWFAAGAVAGLISAVLGATVLVQAVLFVLVSAVFLIFTRPLVKKLFPGKFIPTNSELLVGKSTVVIEEIDTEHSKGRVRLGDVGWTAVSDSGEIIPEGATTTVLSVHGAKLHVKRAVENVD